MAETVMIVTGETSGELYGSLLAASLRKRIPGIRIIGIGGERMQEAGVELVSGIASAFGIAEAVSSFRRIKETFRKASEALITESPAVLVLIDYPDFNLKLAGFAKKNNIKILYYVSPQVWAWRKNRIRKIAGLVDKMAVILPFEKDIYKTAGLDSEFVGHPVLDEIQATEIDRERARDELGLQEGTGLLSLLPGSRPHEVDRLLPVMLEVVRGFKSEFQGFRFCIPFAPNTDLARYGGVIDRLKQEGVLITQGESLRVLAASDVAVIASGTATLQAALLGVPMVVIYKLFPLTYWLGKMIVKVKHISLVNILAGREVVRELLQGKSSPENILAELRRIMTDLQYREDMTRAFVRIDEMFRGKEASGRVAEMVVEMAGWK